MPKPDFYFPVFEHLLPERDFLPSASFPRVLRPFRRPPEQRQDRRGLEQGRTFRAQIQKYQLLQGPML